jgi:voltage-gated potassium channel
MARALDRISDLKSLKAKIYDLYEGDTSTSHRFRYSLLVMDILAIVYLVVSTFFYGSDVTEMLDVIFGTYLAIDYIARYWIADKKLAFSFNPLNLADLVATLSFLAPVLGNNLSFLRGLRILRLLRSYRLQNKLRQDFAFFKRNEDIFLSGVNLFIFIFIMTEAVFISQVGKNPEVKNFLDAMYFTVTTLTTTGFGDITLKGDTGRLLSIMIMVFGVSLFLRLMQTVFRPSRVRYKCKDCGLTQHERDAVHCKHCGAVLNIPNDGEV